MAKVSNRCPLCKRPVNGPFSILVKGFWAYLRGRFYKVHPRCLLAGSPFVSSGLGMTHSYQGTAGNLSHGLTRELGKDGAFFLTRNLHYLWAKTTPRERERALTGKIVLSYRTPNALWGRFTSAYEPRVYLFHNIVGAIFGMLLSLIFIFLIMTGSVSSQFGLLLLIIMPFFISVAIVSFLTIRSTAKAMRLFD